MPPPFERHVFVCNNRRPPESPKGSCAPKGGDAVRDELKKQLAQRGLIDVIRPNAAGCLDACEHGVALVVYPEQVWYGNVTVADVKELVEEHLVHGRPVERLRIRFEPRERKLPVWK